MVLILATTMHIYMHIYCQDLSDRTYWKQRDASFSSDQVSTDRYAMWKSRLETIEMVPAG